jgi:hypothetical protein
MRPWRIKGAWIAVGLAVLGAMVAGGEARAGTAGIHIGGGFKPVGGDPPYDYVFQVYLDPFFEVQANGSPLNNFEVFDLVGVTSGSRTTQPGSSPTVVWTPTPATDDVTWTFTGNTSIPNKTKRELLLGQFTVETTQNFPNGPPVPPGTVIDYTFTVFDLRTGKTITGSDSFQIGALAVPEPSSVVLLSVGAAAMSAIVVCRRRRQAARTA